MRILKLLLVVSILFITGCASTQMPTMEEVGEMPADRSFQGANVIYIQTDDSREEARETVAQIVQTEGYGIVQAESSPTEVATDASTFGSDVQGSARYFFRIPEGDNVRIELHGRVVQARVSDWTRFQQFNSMNLEAGGDRRSLMWNAWRDMETLADIYGGTLLFGRADN